MDAPERPSTPAVESARQAAPEPDDHLTEQQQEFVRLYLLTGKAYPAYVKAFMCETPAELKRAGTYCYRLLKSVEIREALNRVVGHLKRRYRVDPGAALREVIVVAMSSMGDYLDFDTAGVPQFRPGRDVHERAQRAIKGIERVENRYSTTAPDGTVTERIQVRTKIVLHDKLKAMSLLFKHLGLDKTVNPLEGLIALLPLELQHRVGEVLRSPVREDGKPPASKPDRCGSS